MRLLAISWQPLSPVHSGYRQRVVELYGELAKRMEVLVIVPGDSGGAPFARDIQVPSSWRGSLPKGRLWETFSPGFREEAAKIAREWKPDRVLAEGLWAVSAAKSAAQATGVPLGITVQNIEYLSARGIYPPPIPSALRVYERRVYRRADWLVAITEEERETLHEVLGGKCPPILVVPNGTTTPSSPPEKIRVEQIRKSWGIRPEEEVVLFLGNMNYPPNLKGLAWFSKEVYPLLPKEASGVRWIAVGEPIPSEPVHPFEFVGFMGDLDAACAAADVAISPIRHGSGTSIKVLDLLGRGLPIVATPESIRGLAGTENAGVRVGGTPNEFAHRLLELLKNEGERERQGVLGKRWVAANRDWKTIAERFSNDLKEGDASPGSSFPQSSF
ncbi:MAG: glycosyltransferase family 4 protein [Candidatus Omnitrophica bacterium]|nr:glycosyltransferase family 4 protein [Candidatus Omnitrophota bacterium]